MTRLIATTILTVCILWQTSSANPVINEVLANEPGSATSLEWIELYNTSAGMISLDGYQLLVGGDVIDFPSDAMIDAHQYFIVCRRLYAGSTSPGFESYWGDSSGVWGDSPVESLVGVPFEASFSLVNTGATVILSDGANPVSIFAWTEGGKDGYSWERISSESDAIDQSVSNQGSTPGYINSITPVANDLALNDVVVKPVGGVSTITFQIVNRGLNDVSGAVVSLTSNGDNNPADLIAVTSLEAGASTEITREYTLDGCYLPMTAALPDDDRPENNIVDFVACGYLYPPVILSEFLANPEAGLNSEWIEIKNRSHADVNIAWWQIGDSQNLYVITPQEFLIAPGEYVVLVQSATNFLAFFPGFDQNHRYIQPATWPVLNNDGDVVRLVDAFDIEADRYEFSSTFDENCTWSRGEVPGTEDRWGRSETVYGTPGGANSVIFEPTGSELSVTVFPPQVSPDGDGFQDYTTISIDAPEADDYTVKIYDRQGRVVKTFYDKYAFVPPSELEWDGLSDAGNRLPIGIYILYVEAGGVKSIKTSVVIAR